MSKGILVAEGDSWFDYPFIIDRGRNTYTGDILYWLGSNRIDRDRLGYDVRKVAGMGDTIKEMATDDKQLKELKEKLEKVKQEQKAPLAILLSGGGNDLLDKDPHSGESHLQKMLYNADSSNTRLNKEAARFFICDYIYSYYCKLIEKIIAASDEIFDVPIPILVHGYDYPVPDGRAWRVLSFGSGPWLRPAFDRKNWRISGNNQALDKSVLKGNTDAMKEIIDIFNDYMLKTLSDKFPRVEHLDLRNTLSNDLSNNEYNKYWKDEFHPTYNNERGTLRIAKKFDKRLFQLIQTPIPANPDT